eukprot:jgi/Galph1/3552/GphlegSOOS_G2229.1
MHALERQVVSIQSGIPSDKQIISMVAPKQIGSKRAIKKTYEKRKHSSNGDLAGFIDTKPGHKTFSATNNTPLRIEEQSPKGNVTSNTYVCSIPVTKTLKKSQMMLSREDFLGKDTSRSEKFHKVKRERTSAFGDCGDSTNSNLPVLIKDMTNKHGSKCENKPEKDSNPQEVAHTRQDVSTSQIVSLDSLQYKKDVILVFPWGERGYVSVTKEDLKLLEPQGMLNDNLVDFMIKYIEIYLIPHHLRGSVHIFNSFFFTRLQSLTDKFTLRDMESLSRWTAGVNILKQKFLFIPMCIHHHWTLAVICNPGNIMSWNVTTSDPKDRPCICYFDSLHKCNLSRGNQTLLRTYLEMEWKRTRQNVTIEKFQQKIYQDLVIWNVSAPQQQNEFDCGLFMLYYIMQFLQCPPNGGVFSSRKELNLEHWFSEQDIYAFREKMKQLILELASQMNTPKDK